MMMMMMMMMNCFSGIADPRKAFNLISSRDHCQRPSTSQISDTPWAEFKPARRLSSGLVEWSCAVVVTTTLQRHNSSVSEANSPKQLGIILDNRLSFEEHLKVILNKVSKRIRLLNLVFINFLKMNFCSIFSN